MVKAGESPNLDFLRSVAVMDVVAFHLILFFKKTNLGLVWSIGGWGVLLFFVHTCLVLMLSLERHESRMHGAGFFWPFYLRRCFRIFPLSILIVTAIAVFQWPVGHLIHGQFYAVQLSRGGLISNLLLVQNITHTESIEAPLWSLPLELAMYLFLPLLYLMARSIRNVYPLLGLWFLSALSAYASIHIHHSDSYTFLVCVPCFMAGVIAYKLSQVRSFRLPFVVFPPVLAALTFLFLRTPKPTRAWIWCLALGLVLPFFSEMSNVWLRRACHYVARCSYGIYLTHFICIWFAFAYLSRFPLTLRWIVFLATATAAPVILYHTVEAPMISLGHKVVKSLASHAGQGLEFNPPLAATPIAVQRSQQGMRSRRPN
jgi:peptidoglycan/LPS O-acetylase OafA/YrhL